MPASLVTAHVRLESSRGACFSPPPCNGRPRRARAGLGSMAISCAVCRVQRAACRVQACVRARPSLLPSRMRTDELQQNGVDQPSARSPRPLPRVPHLQALMQETDNEQVTTYASSCSSPHAECCAVVARSSCPSPCHPLALVPRSGGIRRQNVVA